MLQDPRTLISAKALPIARLDERQSYILSTPQLRPDIVEAARLQVRTVSREVVCAFEAIQPTHVLEKETRDGRGIRGILPIPCYLNVSYVPAN